MIRAVLDANVLVSGIAFPNSVQSIILDRWVARSFELLISEHVRAEVINSLHKPYFVARLTGTMEDDLREPLLRASVVTLSATVVGVASHPEDDLVLATALSGDADVLVTGDKQLLKLGSFEGIPIVDSRAFLDMLDREAE